VRGIVPGVALAAAVTAVAVLAYEGLDRVLPWEKNPLSVILLAMVLGVTARNVFGLPGGAEAGVRFGIKKLLRFGIILMGIRLSIMSVLKIGVLAVGLVAACIVAALLITILLSRWIGIAPRLGTLIAAGTSICGVSAIAAVSPVIEAEEEETSYAIATITLFGLLATILYPYLAELALGLTTVQAGFFLGTSVHDTSQVTATALIYDQLWPRASECGLSGADIAITTKLVRNTFLILVIPALAVFHRIASKAEARPDAPRVRFLAYIPLFVIGYLLVAILRSVGDAVLGADAQTWSAVCRAVKVAAGYTIAVAIAGVGLNTNLRNLARLGLRPFLCGFAAAIAVGGVSVGLLVLFGDTLRF
jgi:uncharacterized integral membrane protein (TIGR00698 family)